MSFFSLLRTRFLSVFSRLDAERGTAAGGRERMRERGERENKRKRGRECTTRGSTWSAIAQEQQPWSSGWRRDSRDALHPPRLSSSSPLWSNISTLPAFLREYIRTFSRGFSRFYTAEKRISTGARCLRFLIVKKDPPNTHKHTHKVRLTSLSITLWMVLNHSLISESVSDCSRNSFPVTVLSYHTDRQIQWVSPKSNTTS